MLNKTIIAALLALAGTAQAQTAGCTCDTGAARTADATALASLLGNRMVCGNVGGEVWQEWHNGSSSGPIVDYKLGPADPKDPSTTVGSYVVNSNNTVTYSYGGGGGTYTYDVCYVSTSNTYTFCGANYAGRNITGVRVGGSRLQSCSGVTSAVMAVTRKK